jgi:hypothetical protein
MPARKQQSTHWYSVYTVAYVDEATKARVERGEEFVMQSRQIVTESYYSGVSRPKAYAAISRAVLHASRNPLAYAVIVEEDHKSIIRLRVEH